MKKSFVAAAISAAFVSVPAMAAIVGGINLPAPNPIFKATTVYENVVSLGGVPSIAPGASIDGYGIVNQINGNSNFCVGGFGTCELTYRFGGFSLLAGATLTTLDFTGGWIDFYVATGADINFNPFTSAGQAEDITEATDGTLWLSLTGHTFLDLISGRSGTLLSSGTNFGTGIDAGTGIGQLDVIGGLAAAHLNTNSVSDNLGGFSDLDLTSSFSRVGAPPHGETPLAGVASVAGRTQNVPEPELISLLGIGALGLGFAARRKAAK